VMKSAAGKKGSTDSSRICRVGYRRLDRRGAWNGVIFTARLQSLIVRCDDGGVD
jgi:hypothetical protein